MIEKKTVTTIILLSNCKETEINFSECIYKRVRGLRVSPSGAQLRAPEAPSVSHEYVGFIKPVLTKVHQS